MTIQEAPVARRDRLSRARVLQAAMALADDGGIESLTMRRLGEELGVGPMALYRHVANKDDLIDAMVDVVFGEIGVPVLRRRLEDRHARPGNRGPRGPSPPPVGDRHHGVASQSRTGEPAASRCRHRLPPSGRLRYRDGRPRLLGPGQLHLRLRRHAEEPAVHRRGRGGEGGDHAPAVRGRRLPIPHRDAHRSRHAAGVRLRRRVRARPRPDPRRPGRAHPPRAR